MEEPKQRDITDIPVEEGFVVTRMCETGEALRFNRDSRPFLSVNGESVCTFDTLFRMLGRGVVVLDPTAGQMDRYLLADEWKPIDSRNA